MNAIGFDTHAAANRLSEAGFTKEQVEALIDVFRSIVEHNYRLAQSSRAPTSMLR